ncbi:LysR family transcriptional regulator [Roseovarius sp. 2305UL8-3]|uniref:LysR family transcriptional regulator n=1 Tax=Roseovarius conchicola TaxID=3121636 RepID=UPI003526FA98
MSTPLRLSLKTLRAFAVTVEHGSITRAAAELNTAASAIAAALDQVEAEFGAALVVRTRARGIAATAEGRAMAAQFQALLDQYAHILEEGRALSQTLSGTLRIGYYAPVAPAFLPAVIGPLMAGNPGLTLTLHEHDNDSAQTALLAGQLDVILFAGQDLRRGITTTHLLDLPPYLLSPADHPLAKHAPVSLEQIAEEPLVVLDRPLARPYVDGLFRDAGLTPHIAASADSIEMVRAMVGAGAGLAILGMRPLIGISYGGHALACTPLAPGLPSLQLLAGHVTAQPRKLVEAFLEALTTWMASDAARPLTVC